LGNSDETMLMAWVCGGVVSLMCTVIKLVVLWGADWIDSIPGASEQMGFWGED